MPFNIGTARAAMFDDGEHIPLPQVDSYLGNMRIRYTGSVPVDVHMGQTVDFKASAATLVDSLATAGIVFAHAPAGASRWVRFMDRYGNTSATVHAVLQAADVLITGRFNTALTGARITAEPPNESTSVAVDLRAAAALIRQALIGLERDTR